MPRLGNDGFQNFHLQFLEVPGSRSSSSSGLSPRGFSGSGQTGRLEQDRRIQQLSNEGKQFLHWVVEPRVCLKA